MMGEVVENTDEPILAMDRVAVEIHPWLVAKGVWP